MPLRHVCAQTCGLFIFSIPQRLMESHEFRLDPIPPVVREDRLRAKRKVVAESTSKFRQNMKKAGRRKVELFVPEELATTIDRFQKDAGIKNRSEAYLTVIDQMLEELRELRNFDSREETLQRLTRALHEGLIHHREGAAVTG